MINSNKSITNCARWLIYLRQIKYWKSTLYRISKFESSLSLKQKIKTIWIIFNCIITPFLIFWKISLKIETCLETEKMSSLDFLHTNVQFRVEQKIDEIFLNTSSVWIMISFKYFILGYIVESNFSFLCIF